VFAGVGCRAGDANFPTALAGGHRESLAALSASQSAAAIVNRMLGDISTYRQVANMLTPIDGTGGWPTYWGTAADPLYSISCA
jgi:hypothetical protein